MGELVTDDFVIDSTVIVDIRNMPTETRVPRTMKQTIDLETVYHIPSARREFVQTIMAMASSIPVQIEAINDSTQIFKTVLKASTNVAAPMNDFSSYSSLEGLMKIIIATHYCGINRNLFLVHITDFGIGSIDNPYVMASVLLTQTLLPADVFYPEMRTTINNSFAKYILKYKINKNHRTMLARSIATIINEPFPDYDGMTSRWTNYRHDALALMYSIKHLMPPDCSFVPVLNLYFKNIPPTQILQKNEAGDTYSLVVPYLYGSTLGIAERDTRYDDTREKVGMPRNGASSYGSISNNFAEMCEIYKQKMDILVLLTNDLAMTNLYLADKTRMNNVISYFTDVALPRFSTFLRYYYHNMVGYSSSVCADSTLRYVKFIDRELLEIKIQDTLGILLKISPNVELMDNIQMQLLDGLTQTTRMCIFITFYEMVDNIIAKYSEKLTTQDMVIFANGLTARALGTATFDGFAEFGNENTDAALWLNYLKNTTRHRNNMEYINSLVTIVNNVVQEMCDIASHFGFTDTIYLVRDCLHYNNLLTINDTPMIASNAIPVQRLRVMKTYNNLDEIRRDINKIPDEPRQHRIDNNAFIKEFNSLKYPNHTDLLNGTGTIEAIRVVLRAKVVLTIKYETGDFGAKTVSKDRRD